MQASEIKRLHKKDCPFKTSVKIALILSLCFVGIMLLAMPDVMDMDGHIHIVATIMILPMVFISVLIIFFVYHILRRYLYCRNDK